MNTRDYLQRRLMAAVYHRLTVGELFALARTGDPEAFVALVCRRYGLVAAVCRRAGVPAEDVVLDVFLELWRHRDAVADPTALDGWLTTTARRRAMAWSSRESARRRREEARGEGTSAADPAHLAETSELAGLVRRAVAELSAADRAVLAASDTADGDATAAAELGLPVATYRSRLHRARQRLRATLERYGLGPVLGLLWVVTGAAGRVWRTGWVKAVVVCGLATVGVWLGSGNRSAPPTVVALPTAAAVAPEPVPDRNLRVFRDDVRPRLQAALDSMVAGDGGAAVITAVEVHGPRVWVAAELRHGPPQRHTSRVELTYCTYARDRLFFLDPWGDGRYGSINPRDKVVLSRNRVGAPDRTDPRDGFRAILAALERLPPDPRGADARDRDREAIRPVVAAHYGDWCVRGDPAARATAGPPEGNWLIMLEAPRFATVGGTWMDLRRQPDGRVATPCRRFVLSADGTRIDFPLTNDWWVRPPDPRR